MHHNKLYVCVKIARKQEARIARKTNCHYHSLGGAVTSSGLDLIGARMTLSLFVYTVYHPFNHF